MTKKIIIQPDESTPFSCYILLFIIFIGIIYLIVLRQRVNEFFTEDYIPSNVLIKTDINPSEIEKIWEGSLNTNKILSVWQRKNKKTQDLYSLGQFVLLTDQVVNFQYHMLKYGLLT
jgi:hypothetical protein